jgi:peptidoglycan/LPS O-acetylase OafA/YrhL
MSASPISHFWSLAIEEQFYFVWPLLVFVLSKRSLTGVTVAIAILSFSCRAVDAVIDPQGIGFNFYTPYRMEPIAIGSLAAIFAEDKLAWTKLASCRQNLFWGGFVLWATTIFLGDNRGITVFGISAIGAVALAILIDAVNDRSAFNTPIFRHLGKYSYALYVIHYPILFLTHYAFRIWGHFWNSLLSVTVGIPLTYLLSRASWVFIERPFLRLKNQFEYEAISSPEVGSVSAINTAL